MIKFRAHNTNISEQLIYSPPESMHRWCFRKKKKKGGLLYIFWCTNSNNINSTTQTGLRALTMYIINVSAESSRGIRLTNTARDRRDAAGIIKSLWRRHSFFTQCWRAGQVNVFSRQFFCFRFSRSLTD